MKASATSMLRSSTAAMNDMPCTWVGEMGGKWVIVGRSGDEDKPKLVSVFLSSLCNIQVCKSDSMKKCDLRIDTGGLRCDLRCCLYFNNHIT